MTTSLFLFLIFWLFKAQAQVKYASLPSPSIPLAVKSPYLNAWLQYANGTGPGSNVPAFWDHWNVGLQCFIRVDGQTYQWMGTSLTRIPLVKTLTQYISPTRSVLAMMAGAVQMNVTFLSPIEPDDWVKQSFPFTYYYIDIAAADGKEHDIQLYTEITGEWLTPATSTTPITWYTTETNATMSHIVTLKNQQPMKEATQMARDVTMYHVAQKRLNLTWQSGDDRSITEAAFKTNGLLGNSINTTYRNILVANPESYAVFSFSHDLSTVAETTSSIIFALGAVRDPVISYKPSGSDAQNRSALYWSNASSMNDLISTFLDDFPAAVLRADTLDNKVMNDGLEVSSDYADLLALCLRQVMASLDITISQDGNGNRNETDIKTFIRDIGNSSRVNAVDQLYASFPALLYLNSSLAGTVLNPLLELQSGLGAYSAVGDIGPSYPIAWGNVSSDPSLAITYNGDMLFMLAAHAKKSGDTSLISQHYDMLRRWAEFLVSVSLNPGSTYKTTNEINYPNMSNLALQGIVGIHAMSAIAEILGKKDDMETYAKNASSQLGQWQKLAFTGDYLATNYNNPLSWSVMYNLYAAKMLGLEVDQNILDSQSKFYELQATSSSAFGFPYTSEGTIVRAHWLLMTSATTTTTAARDIFIKQVHSLYFWNGTSVNPFPSSYDKNSGFGDEGKASQVLGASFAQLALNLPDRIATSLTNSTSTGIPPPETSSVVKGKNKNIGAIIGGVLGGLVGLLLLCTGGLFIYRKKLGMTFFGKSRKISVDAQPYRILNMPQNVVKKRIDRGDVVYSPLHLAQPQPSNEKSRVQVPPLVSAALPRLFGGGPVNPASGSALPAETSTLRNELEILRQELAEVRANQALPPTYYSEEGGVDI